MGDLDGAGHPFARTVNGNIQDRLRLDRGDRYPHFYVGWRDGDSIHALLGVPDHAVITARPGVLVEHVTDEGGHNIVLATSPKVARPYARVAITWPGGHQTFRVAPSDL